MKDILKNIAALLALFCTGISSSIATFYYFNDTLMFVQDADLPETPTAYLLGGFFGMVFGIMFTLFITFVFCILIFALCRKIKLSFLMFNEKENTACKIFRTIGYLIIIWFAYQGISDWIEYKTFFINGLWFYLSSIAFCAMGIIIFEAIITNPPSADTTKK